MIAVVAEESMSLADVFSWMGSVLSSDGKGTCQLACPRYQQKSFLEQVDEEDGESTGSFGNGSDVEALVTVRCCDSLHFA